MAWWRSGIHAKSLCPWIAEEGKGGTSMEETIELSEQEISRGFISYVKFNFTWFKRYAHIIEKNVYDLECLCGQKTEWAIFGFQSRHTDINDATAGVFHQLPFTVTLLIGRCAHVQHEWKLQTRHLPCVSHCLFSVDIRSTFEGLSGEVNALSDKQGHQIVKAREARSRNASQTMVIP